MRLSPKSVCPASAASRTFSAGCVFVIATSSIPFTARPALAAACVIRSLTRSRFAAIETMQNGGTDASPAKENQGWEVSLARRSLGEGGQSALDYLFANRSVV